MKNVIKCGVAVLVVLVISQVSMSAERKAKRERPAKAVNQQQKAMQEQLKGLTPDERMVARAKMDFEADMAPWRAVLKVAVSEKAAKTVALIEKTITAKETAFQKKMAGLEKRKTTLKNAPKGQRDSTDKVQKKERTKKAKKTDE